MATHGLTWTAELARLGDTRTVEAWVKARELMPLLIEIRRLAG